MKLLKSQAQDLIQSVMRTRESLLSVNEKHVKKSQRCSFFHP